ncbi:MAG: four helix bundle protein [Patescibacteria group bacterium]
MKNSKFDLEERTATFAERVRMFVRRLPRTVTNYEDVKQLVRSSGSVGANYIEANESLSKKDFGMRVKICRKEAKESIYWLRLVDLQKDVTLVSERDGLMQECGELMKIFGAILEKTK